MLARTTAAIAAFEVWMFVFILLVRCHSGLAGRASMSQQRLFIEGLAQQLIAALLIARYEVHNHEVIFGIVKDL